MLPVYVVSAIPLSLIALAKVLAVLRADKKDLAAIIHGPSANRLSDDKRDDDGDAKPPALPKP